jgi:hypothetical protein
MNEKYCENCLQRNLPHICIALILCEKGEKPILIFQRPVSLIFDLLTLKINADYLRSMGNPFV